MKIGELSVSKESTEALGEHFVIRCHNPKKLEFFTASEDDFKLEYANELVLRISKSTAKKLAKQLVGDK
jgi:hypothetical protein